MKSVILSFLLAIQIKPSAQVNIICPNLIDSTLNYFYIGVENPIEITGIKMSANNKISITGSAASIMSVNGNRYIVRTAAVSDSCFISIYEGRKEIFRKHFKTRVITDPVAALAGLKDTAINKSRILINPFLAVVLPNCYYRPFMQVTSFTATFIEGNDSIITMSNGFRFNEEQIKLVKEAALGSKIYFYNIRSIGPDSRARKLLPFWIKIQ